MALKPLCKLQYLAMIALLAMFSACQESISDELIMADKHEKWMSKFHRTYDDEVEKAMRFEVFKENAAYIEAFNQQAAGANKNYKLELNKFFDLTNQEFLARYTGYVSGRRSMMKSWSSFKYAEATDIPESIDWNKKGAVTLVKDQGQCGCCWAFSGIAALEGFYHIKTGELIPWSVQEILDCDADATNPQGCRGGSIESVFEYIIRKDGNMTTDSDYRYTEEQGECRRPKFLTFNVSINNYETVPPNNESALMAAVANQPVAVAIDPNDPSFQFYKEGVYKGPCGTNLTHTVAVVGYGADFWLVKNSWGTDWGEKGYMKLQKDVVAEGLCGLAMEASYPTEDLEQISP